MIIKKKVKRIKMRRQRALPAFLLIQNRRGATSIFECGEYVYAHKAAKAALAFDPFNSSLNMHLTILLYQQSGAGTANAFYTGIKRHLTEAHIQRIKQTCPNMII